MERRKQNHQGHNFFRGVCVLFMLSVIISIHANTPLTKEVAFSGDTLKNQTPAVNPQERKVTKLIGSSVPIEESEPLYIVNGMEVPSEIFSALSGEYIESMEILKDDSATSVYGARGINGVILVKLKSNKQVKEEQANKQIVGFLRTRGIDRRNMRYYVDGKEVPARVAYQTNIELIQLKTGTDGKLEVYIQSVASPDADFE